MQTLEKVHQSEKALFTFDNLGSYEQDIKVYLSTYGNDFSFESIRSFITSSTKTKTRNKRVNAFTRFYRNNITNEQALKVKLDELKPLRVKEEIQPIDLEISKAECKQVIEYFRTREPARGRNTDKLKYRKLSLIVKVLYLTGLRISELINIHRNNIKLNGVCKIEIIGKGSKQRFTEISRKLHQEIQETFNSKDWLFCTKTGNRLDRNNILKEIEKAYRELFGVKVGLHTHRHLFATELVKAGTPIHIVSKMLGHSDVNTTAKYYLHQKPDYTSLQGKLL